MELTDEQLIAKQTAAATGKEPPAATPPPATAPAAATPPASAPVKTDDTPPPTKSFEEHLAERSKGKFKKWEDVEPIFTEYETLKTAPPKEREYSHVAVKAMDDFIRNGGTPDNNWFKHVSTDYDKITDPYQLLSEKMRLESKGITDDEIDIALDKKYDRGEWDALKESTDPQEQKKFRALNAQLSREAEEAKSFLKDYQQKASVKSTAPTPEQLQEKANKELAAKAATDAALAKWDSGVDEAAKSFSKLPISIKDDKGEVAFDFELDKKQQDQISQFAKTLGKDTYGAFMSKYADDKGNVNVAKILEHEAKLLAFDSILSKAVTNARAAGAASIVKPLKNVNFKPGDTNINLPEGLWEKQQAAMQASAKTKAA